MRKIAKYKHYFFTIGLVILSVIPLFDLFHVGLPLTHDGQDHVARIANFYKNLTDGNIFPRWAPNLNWGYGHPILMFLYPLPSYVASLFHFLGFSLVDSMKIVLGLGFVASSIAMYIWLKEFLGIRGAFVGALLYAFAPYRFVDIYVRGAIGENMAFVFPPLIFYFILKVSRQSKFAYIVGGAFSFAGLVLSHNAITLMFLPIIILYSMYLILQTKKKKYLMLNIFYLILLGFGFSSFFLMPAFFEGKYTLRDIVTGTEYSSSFVSSFKDFIYTKWSYGGTGKFSVQVGIAHWFLILASLPLAIVLYKKRNNLWMLTLTFIIIFASSLFLMLPYSEIIWQNITTLQKFQFPWRFLSVSVFIAAVLGGLVVSIISNRFKNLAVFLLLAGILFFNKDYWHAQGYLQKPENFFTGIYHGTTDTGESAPIWSVRFMEKRAKANIEVISGNARIEKLKRNSTEHLYKIIAVERSRIKENTLYFPGWNVYVDGQKTDIEFQDPSNRGLITFFLNEGERLVSVEFKETKLRSIADIISFFSLLSVVILGILKKANLWRRFRWF